MILGFSKKLGFIALFVIVLASAKHVYIKSLKASFQGVLQIRKFCTIGVIALTLQSSFVAPSFGDDKSVPSLQTELQSYEEDLEFAALRQQRDPKTLMQSLTSKLSAENPSDSTSVTKADINDARERVLTLKAYLDEAERDLFAKNWDNLQIYLYTFADQEDAFVTLIDNLFPASDDLDKAARAAMSFEAKSMFLSLDKLRDAAKDQRFKTAQRAYSQLLLSYDRFLKAGDLYATYDPITSTEVFFTKIPKSALPFDLISKVQILDNVVLMQGPDMGKTGTVVFIDGDNAVIKLDKDGKAYQEVKYVKLKILAKVPPEDIKGKKGSPPK